MMSQQQIWKWRLAVAAACTLVCVGTAMRLTAEETRPAKPPLHLVIDYGDGVEKHFTQLAWREGMTVLDLLAVADQHPRGIEMKYRGRGATAFLTQIDDLANEGRERNWVYRVNNKLADKSFAVFTLNPGDTVLWKFGEYR